MDLSQFLMWLGTPAAAGLFISHLLEYMDWFQAQDSATKSRLVMLIYLGLGVLSFALQHLPPEAIAAFDPLFKVILASGAAFAVTEYGHKLLHTE